MNILLCGNEKVFDGALTELISITNKTKSNVTCYIFTMDLSRVKSEYKAISDKQVEYLDEVIKNKNPENKVIKVDVTEIYEKELQSDDPRLGGLYNNLGLTLTDLKRFDEAEEYYNKAINVMSNNKNGELEIAITYLNLCDLNEAKLGSEQSEKIIDEYIEKAYELLNRDYLPRNGYYAFVCEKCAPTFGYFGRFLYQKELSDRARCIYERN